MAATVPIVSAASIDQRFAQLIQQFGLTKNSFAISLGKTASVVQHLIDGRNKPGFDLMCKVFEIYPNVSRDWLLLGRGPMLVGSNGSTAPPIAAPAPAASAPVFEPIDLADVAPRTARRTAVARLQPEEIAATLALATAIADSPLAPASEPALNASEVVESGIPATGAAMPASVPAGEFSPQRSARPFRTTAVPTSRSAALAVNPEMAVAPGSAPEPEILAPVHFPAQPAAAVSPTPAASIASLPPVAAPGGGPEAYVAAAIHAQHLQHQLALAELRNQHLLEQQQMLREMLVMARQSMV